MYPLTVKQICELTDGICKGRVKQSAAVDGCVIDSRDVQKGDAFFGLDGTKQHGAKFATEALTAGADVVIVDETASEKCRSPHICVPDAEIALAQLAQQNRRISEALVIGVTGSVGKTTSRCMITAVLETVYTGIQSPRNFNNHLGVPLSLLELQDGDEFAVIEIGASRPGEVAALASIAEPEFAVVTRVTPAHLGGFGSLQAVQKAKQELVQSLSPDSTAFLNIDDPLVAEMATTCRCRVITFGTGEAADIRATTVTPTDETLTVVVDSSEYTVPVCGRHHITSVLAAIAVGLETGIAPDQINAGLQRFVAPSSRCTVSKIGTCTVIDDTYNSSPASVAAAIQTVEEFQNCRHRILALSDMLDLGEQAPDLHYGIGAALASSQIDHVAVTGQFAGDVVEGFLTSGGELSRISQFSDLQLMTTMLDIVVSDNDVLLVKGSRSTQMERLISALRTIQLSEDTVATRRAA